MYSAVSVSEFSMLYYVYSSWNQFVPIWLSTYKLAFINFTGYESPTEEEQLRAIWNEVNVGATGFLDKNELSVVCDHIGMDSMIEQVCDVIKLS